MCKVDIYPFLNPDGTQGSRREKTKCEVARRGDACPDREVFRHALTGTHLPPSPMSTPRSSTPNYRSGDESAGSSGSRRRRSGIYIEVNGRPVYHDSERRRRRDSERVIVVESPPTARTPPQRESHWPRTAPPSPSPMDSSRRPAAHPIIVDERTVRRPSVHITTPPSGYMGHHRTASNSSHHSRSSASDDERFRWETYVPRQRQRRPTQAELDRERLQQRIAAANAEINRRPPVPMPPTPPQRSASTYIRPAVELRYPSVSQRATNEIVADEQRRMRQKEEEEAQKARLRERMTPQRRASVGNGARRTRVAYPDGVYRWD